MQFVRANLVTSIQGAVTESMKKPTVCGKEVRSFYETLLAEPSTSEDPNVTVTVKLGKIKNKSQNAQKFTKLSSKISKRRDNITKNSEQLFKDAANGNMQGVMDYYCEKGICIMLLIEEIE